MFVLHRKHITSPLRLMGSIGVWRWYNITITILDIVNRPVFYLKHTMGMFVPHRKHITSPLQTQKGNAIYRFVTMVD
jgi:hypothetical protein